MYDILIIGAGPAGLTAAIYAARAGKSVLLLEKETFGGQYINGLNKACKGQNTFYLHYNLRRRIFIIGQNN